MRTQHDDPRTVSALMNITPGAASRILKAKTSPLVFFEQVAVAGRRLAKLNIPPQAIVHALQHYDALLVPVLEKSAPGKAGEFQWVREQVHFCIILTLNEAYYQVREAETQAFHEIFSIELESRNPDILLRRFLESMAQLFGAESGHLYLAAEERDDWILRASTAHGVSDQTRGVLPLTAKVKKFLGRPRHLQKQDLKTYALDKGWVKRGASVWSFPLQMQRNITGVMQLAFPENREWLPRDEELLAAAVERCLMATDRAKLVEGLAQREQQLRYLAEHMLQVEEMERRRISRELHDEAGQSLICIRLQLELIEMSLPEGSGVTDKLVEARDLTERTILEMRRLIADLSPVVLEQFGLEAALRQLVKRFQSIHRTKVSLNTSGLERLPSRLEIVAYRIIQECFNNISKHSLASSVNICVSSADGLLRLLVEDNGVGFHVESALAKKESFGLSGIRERVALLGGRFVVESRPLSVKEKTKGRTGGSSIRIEIPIPLEANWKTA